MAENYNSGEGGVLVNMQGYFHLKESDHVKTSSVNKEFYNKVVDELGLFSAKHQLYTYAILVAILRGAEVDISTKSEDICLVGNVNSDNLAIVKGLIAKLNPDIKDGNSLLKRMHEYADAGINLLRIEYENNGVFRMDQFID